ncbi:DUF4381 domain-containing protein [Rhizobium sp. BK251]|uniref:DUF4381 domain-containing protein n=1 Tax=Rhizobium sp. BK251 TaxID=2512125 RepID=UPI0010525739|nr:DUF4381 domain-containing protein [Rhizobium sp. BK251]TCL74000.1 uncharacterized protein DUF4381 [Rhizobium sp. BK251]
MDETAPALDPSARAILQQLADVALPSPVSWMPQTIGWAFVGLILVLMAIYAGWRWLKRYRANRYRREALAELARLEAAIADPQTRPEALCEIPALLKRTALAAWPREAVAPLSGQEWCAFLEHSGDLGGRPTGIHDVLQDIEYRGRAALMALPENEYRAIAASARRWIERHHVPA